LIPERAKLEAALAALASAETEWKLLTAAGAGGPVGDLHVEPSNAATLAALRYIETHGGGDRPEVLVMRYYLALGAAREREAVKGPIPERIRAALDKPVKLGPKGTKFTFPQALEVLEKEAGWDVPMRGRFPVRVVPGPGNLRQELIEITSEGEELPVGAWFQLIEDNAIVSRPNEPPVRFRFYVREYGVLISPVDFAPPDAPTLTEFWKHKPPAQGAKDEPTPKK
jgi:hypothetical protein